MLANHMGQNSVCQPWLVIRNPNKVGFLTSPANRGLLPWHAWTQTPWVSPEKSWKRTESSVCDKRCSLATGVVQYKGPNELHTTPVVLARPQTLIPNPCPLHDLFSRARDTEWHKNHRPKAGMNLYLNTLASPMVMAKRLPWSHQKTRQFDR